MEELKEGWRRVKLENLGEIVSGGTPKTSMKEYWNGKVAWLTPKDFSNQKNKYWKKGERSITDEGLKNSSAKLMPKGTVLFTSRAPIGYVGIANTEVSTNQGFKNIIANKENSNEFIYYLLKYITPNIESIAGGSTFKEISASAFKNIEVEVPDLETQEKIASILSALDDKIEINNEMNKTLEEMAQTLFKRWFIDFDFPNENGEPYRSSGGKMVDSELGEIPEGWEVTKIENVVNIKRGASPRPIQDFVSDNGIPWIKISDATSSISKFLNKTNEFIIEKGKEKSRFIERGTLILSNSATPGIPMIVNLDACVHDGWLIFNEYKNITREFLYYVLKYHKENILALSNGSVFRNLKTDILKNYKIILPNLDLIILFNKNLEIIDKYIRNNVEEIQSLTEIRDTLLPKLMSGEIEV